MLNELRRFAWSLLYDDSERKKEQHTDTTERRGRGEKKTDKDIY